jgi:hypothetical protein
VDDASAGTVRVTGSSRGSRGPTIVGGVLVAFLLLAILKPWAGAQPESGFLPSEPPSASAAIVVASTPPPTPEVLPDPNGMACLTDRPTQVLTLQRSTTGEVRSWVVAPDGSLDPNDPALSTVTLYSRRFVGIGICHGQLDGAGDAATAAPGTTSGPGSSEVQRATILDVRLLLGTPTAPKTVDLGAPSAITTRLDAPDSAILFGPPTSGSAVGSAGPVLLGGPVPIVWSAGTYLFGYRLFGDAVSGARSPAVVSWLRIEVRDTAGVS